MERTQIHRDLLTVLKPFMRKLPGGFEIREEMSLQDDLLIDSADLIDIVLKLEEQFAISIDDSRLSKLKTVADVVSVVESTVGKST